MVNSFAQQKWSGYILPAFILIAIAQSANANIVNRCAHQIGVLRAANQEISLNLQLSSIFDLKQAVVTAEDDEFLRMKKLRYNSALEELLQTRLELATGHSNLDLVLDAGKCVVQTGLEVTKDPSERVKLHSNFLAVTKFCEGIAEVRVQAAGWRRNQVLQARQCRLEAEVQLAKAKEAIESKSDKK